MEWEAPPREDASARSRDDVSRSFLNFKVHFDSAFLLIHNYVQ